MRKVLIPTKLDKVAANLLTEKGFDVVFDTATPMDELIKRNPDTEVLIVRSENVTPEVIDGPHSVIYDEAENRLHAQKALVSLVMAPKISSAPYGISRSNP